MTFLFVPLALADVVGVTFTTRRELAVTTTGDCAFRGCGSSSKFGSALQFDGNSASPFLARCLFENCRGPTQCGAARVGCSAASPSCRSCGAARICGTLPGSVVSRSMGT
jgi:hypothetical protein